jgi:site-specific DNA-adenine methylase
MGLRPVIKASSSRHKVADWIVEKFPEGYQNMEYLEPFLGDGSVLLSKDSSVEEVASDSDSSLVSVWRSLRDEQSTFSSRVKRIEHSKATFERYSKASGGDYMDEAIREFVLRHMSKSALKKTYLPKDGKVKCKECWCDIFERMPAASERVRGVFFLNRDAIEMLRSFNHDGCLVFCDPPEMEPGASEFHSEFGELVRDFRGKALVAARNSTMYRRLFSQWNRRGIPGGGNESLWVNF